WLEPVNPLIAKQEIRYKIPPTTDGKDVILSLVTTDAGDGNEHDFVIWQQPRLVAPGRPDILLREVRSILHNLTERRIRIFAKTSAYLIAADEVAKAQGKGDPDGVAQKYGLEGDAFRAWLDYLGIGSGDIVEVRGHFTKTMTNVAGYDFVKGWGGN